MSVTYCPKTNKVQYKTWGEAERALNGIARTRREKMRGSVYKCRHCHYFHITHYSYKKQKDFKNHDISSLTE